MMKHKFKDLHNKMKKLNLLVKSQDAVFISSISRSAKKNKKNSPLKYAKPVFALLVSLISFI